MNEVDVVIYVLVALIILMIVGLPMGLVFSKPMSDYDNTGRRLSAGQREIGLTAHFKRDREEKKNNLKEEKYFSTRKKKVFR